MVRWGNLPRRIGERPIGPREPSMLALWSRRAQRISRLTRWGPGSVRPLDPCATYFS